MMTTVVVMILSFCMGRIVGRRDAERAADDADD